MTGIEIIQISVAMAGVAVGGGIWFKLGALTAAIEAVHAVAGDLRDRIERLEDAVFLGKGS